MNPDDIEDTKSFEKRYLNNYNKPENINRISKPEKQQRSATDQNSKQTQSLNNAKRHNIPYNTPLLDEQGRPKTESASIQYRETDTNVGNLFKQIPLNL